VMGQAGLHSFKATCFAIGESSLPPQVELMLFTIVNNVTITIFTLVWASSYC
jgi:hypothetical protein